MSDDPVERTLISERLRHLEAAELAEHAMQAELIVMSRETRDGVRELVAQGSRREEREVEALRVESERREASAEAETARVKADIEDRRTARNWLRTAIGDKILVPLGVSVSLAVGGLLTALAAYAGGMFGP